ncbi:MAG: hypothetical protein DRJ38_00330 [Thermoprotei archaeon]|nr:MAG: hypothetical protein DRJ38_00330 [Thermoprotei archaeon]
MSFREVERKLNMLARYAKTLGFTIDDVEVAASCEIQREVGSDQIHLVEQGICVYLELCYVKRSKSKTFK